MLPELARVVVERGYCTREQVEQVLARLKDPSKLGPLLVASGYLTREALDEVTAELRATQLESVYDPNAPGDYTMPPPENLGSYRVVEEIGQGGMGLVYRAEHEVLGHQVAIKVLPKIALRQKDAFQRFLREAQITSQLHHENIVRVTDWGHEEDLVYFVMELVEGRALDQVLGKGGVGQKKALRIVETIARAIHYAHENGVLHRDLKPGNILLGDDGMVKITDFGLARMAGDDATITRSGLAIGTPAYMSPEQCRGDRRAVDRRSDVFSLGVILYELVAGRRPFLGKSTADLFRQIETTQPPSLRAANKAAPKALDAIVFRAMAKEPAERYPTAEAMADDLLALLEQRRIDPRTDSGLRRLARRTKGLKGVLVLLVLVVLAGIVGAMLVMALGDPTPTAVDEPWRGPADSFDQALTRPDFEAARDALAAMAGAGAPESDLEGRRRTAREALTARFEHLLEQDDLEGAAELLSYGPGFGLPERAIDSLRRDGRARAAAIATRSLTDGEFRRAEAQIAVARTRFGDDAVLVDLSRWARGECSLSIATEPPGARVTAQSYSTEDFRPIGDPLDLGPTPVDAGLRFGTHQLRIESHDGRTHELPIRLARDESGRPRPLALELPLADVPDGMVLVPATDALVGPQANPIRIRTFLIDRTEVTNEDYARYLAALPTDHARFRRTPAADFNHLSERPAVPPWSGARPRSTHRLHPVTLLDEERVLGYCSWRGVRLPIGDEWEIAARGVDGRLYPWGSAFEPGRARLRAEGPLAVGSMAGDRSPYGCLDMAGNVRERIATDDRTVLGVIRGGSFLTDEREVFDSELIQRSDAIHDRGFRAARSIVRGDHLQALADPDDGVRLEAARRAGELPSTARLVRALADLATDDRLRIVRRQAARSLAAHDLGPIAGDLLTAAARGSESALEAALLALPADRLEEAVPLIVGHDLKVQMGLLDLLLDRHVPAARTGYQSIVDTDVKAGFLALCLLGGLGDERALFALRSYPDRVPREYRPVIARLLWRLGEPAAILLFLEEAYADPTSRTTVHFPGYDDVSLYFVNGLGAPELRRGLDHQNEGVRYFCAIHLGSLGDRSAAEALGRLAGEDPFDAVREAARRSLELLR